MAECIELVFAQLDCLILACITFVAGHYNPSLVTHS